MINIVGGAPADTSGFRHMTDFVIPKGIDWIGLECYAGAADCKAMVDQLKAMPSLSSNVRFWPLLPLATNYGTEAWLVANAHATYDWAHAEPTVIGLIGFVWSKVILCPPDCTSLATKELPTLLSTMRTIGDAITGRGNVAPLKCP
jgi:hypothetical protein